MMQNYWKPTPKRYRQLGDSILYGCTALSGMMMGSPLTDNGKLWAIFILNATGVIGKTITNFFKDDEPEVAEQPKPENSRMQ